MDRIIAVRLLCRLSAARNAVIKQPFHSSVKLLNAKDSSSSSSSSSSSDSSDCDAEKPKKSEDKVMIKGHRDEAAKQQTVDLLNDLLSKMNGEKLLNNRIDLAVPVRKPFPNKVKEKTLEDKLKIAAKDVAESLGGDVKKKEEELLDKIFSAGTPPPVALVNKKLKKRKEKQVKMEGVAEKPAKEIVKKDEVIAKDEDVPEKKEEVPEPSLSKLLAVMKIDKTPRKFDQDEGLPFTRAAKIRELAQKFQGKRTEHNTERLAARAGREVVADLYAGKPFTILGGPSPLMEEITTKLNTWQALEEKELKLLITHPPENYFEELIQWTERGILWKFPIDNEQAMEAEQSVHFSEHVFLDRHLQDWCPKKGPIRHFMELVCTGLSKNPYMTVEEKKEHIIWYRDYFGDKQSLLKEIGAIDRDILPEGKDKKRIEA